MKILRFELDTNMQAQVYDYISRAALNGKISLSGTEKSKTHFISPNATAKKIASAKCVTGIILDFAFPAAV